MPSNIFGYPESYLKSLRYLAHDFKHSLQKIGKRDRLCQELEADLEVDRGAYLKHLERQVRLAGPRRKRPRRSVAIIDGEEDGRDTAAESSQQQQQQRGRGKGGAISSNYETAGTSSSSASSLSSSRAGEAARVSAISNNKQGTPSDGMTSTTSDASHHASFAATATSSLLGSSSNAGGGHHPYYHFHPPPVKFASVDVPGVPPTIYEIERLGQFQRRLRERNVAAAQEMIDMIDRSVLNLDLTVKAFELELRRDNPTVTSEPANMREFPLIDVPGEVKDLIKGWDAKLGDNIFDIVAKKKGHG